MIPNFEMTTSSNKNRMRCIDWVKYLSEEPIYKTSLLKEMIRASHRIFVDTETASAVSEIKSRLTVGTLVSTMQRAFPPYEKTWVEPELGTPTGYDFSIFTGFFVERLDEREVSIMIVVANPNTSTFFISPWSVRYNLDVVEKLDKTAPLSADVILQHFTVYTCPIYTEEANEKINARNEPILPDGDVFLWLITFLAIFNEKTYFNESHSTKPKTPRLVKGKLVPYRPSTDITLAVPREIMIREATARHNAEAESRRQAARPQWKVSGSWHTRRPKAVERECQHEFANVEREENKPPRRICKLCQALSWWTKPHSKGDPAFGTMLKNTQVKLGRKRTASMMNRSHTVEMRGSCRSSG